MKVHIGVDSESGLIHSVQTTAANVHDLTAADELLHGEETVVYADAGSQGIAKRPQMEGKAIEFCVAIRPGQRRVLPETAEGRLLNLIEKAKAHIRANGEHPFRIVKQPFSFQKTRLRGMAEKSLQGACARRADESVLGSPSITGADLKVDWCLCLAKSGPNSRGKDLGTRCPVAGSSVRAQEKAQMEQLRISGLSTACWPELP